METGEPTLQMGYFDGRQIAAETAIGVLALLLEEKGQQALDEGLSRLRNELAHDTNISTEAIRGFDDFLLRLRRFLFLNADVHA